MVDVVAPPTFYKHLPGFGGYHLIYCVTYLLCESTQTNSSAFVMLVFIVSNDECLINLLTAGSELSEPALTLE